MTYTVTIDGIRSTVDTLDDAIAAGHAYMQNGGTGWWNYQPVREPKIVFFAGGGAGWMYPWWFKVVVGQYVVEGLDLLFVVYWLALYVGAIVCHYSARRNWETVTVWRAVREGVAWTNSRWIRNSLFCFALQFVGYVVEKCFSMPWLVLILLAMIAMVILGTRQVIVCVEDLVGVERRYPCEKDTGTLALETMMWAYTVGKTLSFAIMAFPGVRLAFFPLSFYSMALPGVLFLALGEEDTTDKDTPYPAAKLFSFATVGPEFYLPFFDWAFVTCTTLLPAAILYLSVCPGYKGGPLDRNYKAIETTFTVVLILVFLLPFASAGAESGAGSGAGSGISLSLGIGPTAAGLAPLHHSQAQPLCQAGVESLGMVPAGGDAHDVCAEALSEIRRVLARPLPPPPLIHATTTTDTTDKDTPAGDKASRDDKEDSDRDKNPNLNMHDDPDLNLNDPDADNPEPDPDLAALVLLDTTPELPLDNLAERLEWADRPDLEAVLHATLAARAPRHSAEHAVRSVRVAQCQIRRGRRHWASALDALSVALGQGAPTTSAATTDGRHHQSHRNPPHLALPPVLSMLEHIGRETFDGFPRDVHTCARAFTMAANLADDAPAGVNLHPTKKTKNKKRREEQRGRQVGDADSGGLKDAFPSTNDTAAMTHVLAGESKVLSAFSLNTFAMCELHRGNTGRALRLFDAALLRRRGRSLKDCQRRQCETAGGLGGTCGNSASPGLLDKLLPPALLVHKIKHDAHMFAHAAEQVRLDAAAAQAAATDSSRGVSKDGNTANDKEAKKRDRHMARASARTARLLDGHAARFLSLVKTEPPAGGTRQRRGGEERGGGGEGGQGEAGVEGSTQRRPENGNIDNPIARDTRMYTMEQLNSHRGVVDALNRATHVPSLVPPPDMDHVLNPLLDWDALSREYFASQPHMIVVDDVLTPKGLQMAHRACLEQTVWYDGSKRPGYVGAYIHAGFHPGIMLAIGLELRKRLWEVIALPHLHGGGGDGGGRGGKLIFGEGKGGGKMRESGNKVTEEDEEGEDEGRGGETEHDEEEMGHLEQMWAYKYDQEGGGIDTHADFAVTNANIWLTPDSAHIKDDPTRGGGLVVFHKPAPAHFDFDDYNCPHASTAAACQERIRTLLTSDGFKNTTVPYRANRMILFDSR